MATFTNVNLGTGTSSEATTSWTVVILTTSTSFATIGSFWADASSLSVGAGYWELTIDLWEELG